MRRFEPDCRIGLTNNQVKQRIAENLVYEDVTPPTKSIKQIVSSRFFTLFNFLHFGLALAIILVHSYKNLLFIGTVLLNMSISILQEIRAKKIVDKLSLISESKVTVIRDSKRKNINKEDIVLDDLICLKVGNQVVTDSIVVEGECLVNESFITGEEDPINKKKGDLILSGSFIVGGNVVAKVEHIKEDNYTSKISKDAKYLKKVNSEIMNSLNKVLKVITIAIIPIGTLLFMNQLTIENNPLEEAVVASVAGLIGMIPDGLVLLTSTVLAIAVIKLSKYNVLVQELYCIETLARVDVLCLDKTGTITEGSMEVKKIVNKSSLSDKDIKNIIDSFCHTIEDDSPTMKAIREFFETKSGSSFKAKKINAFSSDKKYSSIELENETYYLGAPEFIMGSENSFFEDEYRVLLLAREKNGIKERLAYILIQDRIRKEAKTTLEYFKKQGVEIKIISGDNPVTVSKIAKRVGVDNYDKYVDLSTIKTKDELREAYLSNSIFGRVTPEQKKELILLIKSLGHTVAMTGDGVNDVLALKEADCSIAMATGSDAARNVSELVLLDSNFDSLPKIVKEGRQSINNIQRSASFFLTKTIYTVLLVTFFIIIGQSYPFRPIHLSFMNFVTVGTPALILALEPNQNRVKGNFLSNVIAKAMPTSLTVFTIIVILSIIGCILGLTSDEQSTMSVILTTVIMLIHQYRVCKPFNILKILLMASMIAIFLVIIIFFKDFFILVSLNSKAIWILGVLMMVSLLVWNLYTKTFEVAKDKYRLYKSKKMLG